MTRADAIRKMSDEELAVFMARLTLGRAPTDREFLFALSHLQGEDEYALDSVTRDALGEIRND